MIDTCSELHPVWEKADARSAKLSPYERVAFALSGWIGGSVLVLLAKRKS